jgi:hypothetical protein
MTKAQWPGIKDIAGIHGKSHHFETTTVFPQISVNSAIEDASGSCTTPPVQDHIMYAAASVKMSSPTACHGAQVASASDRL